MGGCIGTGGAQLRTKNDTQDGSECGDASDVPERDKTVEKWRRLGYCRKRRCG